MYLQKVVKQTDAHIIPPSKNCRLFILKNSSMSSKQTVQDVYANKN